MLSDHRLSIIFDNWNEFWDCADSRRYSPWLPSGSTIWYLSLLWWIYDTPQAGLLQIFRTRLPWKEPSWYVMTHSSVCTRWNSTWASHRVSVHLDPSRQSMLQFQLPGNIFWGKSSKTHTIIYEKNFFREHRVHLPAWNQPSILLVPTEAASPSKEFIAQREVLGTLTTENTDTKIECIK